MKPSRVQGGIDLIAKLLLLSPRQHAQGVNASPAQNYEYHLYKQNGET